MSRPTETKTRTATVTESVPPSANPLSVVQKRVETKQLPRDYSRIKAADLNFQQEKIFFWSIVSKSEDLMQATEDSLRDAFLQAASIGLSFNPQLALVYLYPRRARRKADGETWPEFEKNVPFVAYASPGYRGLIHLAILGGAIKWARAEIVHERDVFKYFGPTTKPEFEANVFANRGARVGVFCHAKGIDGTDFCDWMDTDTVEKIRAKAEFKNSLMWTTFWEEGAKKAILRRAQKTWPHAVAAPLLQRAMEILNDNEGIDTSAAANAIEHEPQTITEEQVTELHAIVTDSGSTSEAADNLLALLAKRYGKVRVEDIPADKFEEAKGKILEKVRAKNKKAEATTDGAGA